MAHYALPLLIARPGGLLVEVTDGTAEYNATHYRLSPFYDLAKTAIIGLAWAHARDLAPHGATSVAVTPGWLRSEMMPEAFGVTEDTWRDATAKVRISSSPKRRGSSGARSPPLPRTPIGRGGTGSRCGAAGWHRCMA